MSRSNEKLNSYLFIVLISIKDREYSYRKSSPNKIFEELKIYLNNFEDGFGESHVICISDNYLQHYKYF